MKRLKFLPSVFMLIVCMAVLCVGVFSLTPTENTIGGTINISSMARVKLACYVDEKLIYDNQSTAYGVDWDLSETALDFDVSQYASAYEVPQRTIRIHIQNLTDLHLGVYFFNGDETTLQTIDGQKYATYDSLKLSDAVYKANAEETEENKLIDIYLSSYGYMAPANSDNAYDECDMYITFGFAGLDVAEVSKVVSYILRIEGYQSNVTIDSSNNASFTSIEGRTKQLVKLPTTNTDTEVPTFSNAGDVGGVVITTAYETIGYDSFTGCKELKSLIVPSSITSILWSAFSGLSGLKSVFISDGTNLEGAVFADCTALAYVRLPNDMDRLPDDLFENCTSLISITIPESVRYIGEDTFYGCSGLTSITIPRNTEAMEDNAIQNCTNLKEIIINSGNVYVYAANPFYDWANVPINKVLASVIDSGDYFNQYLEDPSEYTRSETAIDGYYVFTKIS